MLRARVAREDRARTKVRNTESDVSSCRSFAKNRTESAATNSDLKAPEKRRRIFPPSMCTTTVVLRPQWHQKLARMLANLRTRASLRSRVNAVHPTIVVSVAKHDFSSH